jgi:hypothetical protein
MRNFNEKKNRGAQSWGPAMIRGARPSEGELRRGEAATWGRPPAPERPRMRLVSWKPLIKGALRGFATLELPIGLKLIDCPILIGRDGPWASLPSKPQVDKEGRQKVDVNGKRAFEPVLEWRDRALSDRFSDAVVALVRAEHPHAFDGGAL